MRHKNSILILSVCLALMLSFSASSLAAASRAQIANLRFSGPVSQADQEYLGLKNSGNFSLQDIQAPYVLIELIRTT
jgi:hypothetical protein